VGVHFLELPDDFVVLLIHNCVTFDWTVG
jgi:hypothetical protein